MSNAPELNLADYLKVYQTMVLSRGFDERCDELNRSGKAVPHHFHSGVGQEALMVASVYPLRPTDQMIYTHRGYGHLMAKGVPVEQIALDMFMKKGGTNEGLGGVMHVSRPDLGVPGREGAFGTRFGIAAGLALASKLDGKDDVTICFYGEAAGARGILYEAMNMAVLWKLPVIFVAENNGWSFSSRTEWLYPGGRMSSVWRGFDIPVEVIDGNNPAEVFSSVSTAIANARSGEGPSVIEGLTYRIDPHHWFDNADYHPAEEIEQWRKHDPLIVAREQIAKLGGSMQDIHAAEAAARAEIERAFDIVDHAEEATWEDRKIARATWHA
ncbi:MAG: thiamine pyrophosphate-dependent dehydrogenase E1 component subunit alpha [Rhizobiaceae bacterium]|nr:thiamine pyrophosphate-dependent dehydrogenase E1 component subunit alpha [Rhizobiaceae bacterium]